MILLKRRDKRITELEKEIENHPDRDKWKNQNSKNFNDLKRAFWRMKILKDKLQIAEQHLRWKKIHMKCDNQQIYFMLFYVRRDYITKEKKLKNNLGNHKFFLLIKGIHLDFFLFCNPKKCTTKKSKK